MCCSQHTRICLKILNHKLQIYNSVPKFADDWRWYKSLHGKSKNFNENFILEYNKVSHSLIDYRINSSRRSIKKK